MTYDAKKFGNTSGRSEFSDNGTLSFFGDATVFDDLLGDATRTQTVGTRVTINNTESVVEFTSQATVTDYLFLNMQMSHRWKIGSRVYPHVHWLQNQNARPNWLIQYRWQRNGEAQTTAWSNYAMPSNAFTYSSGILNQISHDSGFLPPSGAGLSDVIQIRLIRDTQNTTGLFSGVDTYSGTAQVTSIDMHIEIDTIGSNQEYVK